MKRLQVFPHHMKKNLELTRGLVYSQRVMLALIGKGLSRQKAYEIVQRNAMKAWKGNRNFLNLLKKESEVTGVMSLSELEGLFDYQHYLQHVDEIFRRLGLTKPQWQGTLPDTMELGPRSI